MKKYLLVLLVSLVFTSAYTQSLPGSPFQNGSIILRGTVILPDGVSKHAYVGVSNGRIVSISDNPPALQNATFINTNGIILPGFVDLHNHIPFNVFPRWKPGRLFTNRNQWRTDPEVIAKVNGPMDRLQSTYFCDMNAWGELRALVGGTTSTMVTQPQPCVSGLVRNLDCNSGFYGTTELDREHVFNVLDLPPANNPAVRAGFVAAANFFISNPFYEALFIHLAEGTDAASLEEFTFMQSQSLLNPKGVVIHGIPLGAGDFQAMALHETALVWSPRSNIELYGSTANIGAATDAGVEIAIAPDWAITGSSNMLDELKVAAQWNREQLGGRLSERQLVEMVTSVPSHIGGVDDEVGSIRVGLRADLLVINGDQNNPYRSVIDATPADVDLVLINGVPIYGDRKFMKDLWNTSQLEDIVLTDVTKNLATPAANINVANIRNSLQLALEAEGVSLAPLTEPNPSLLSSSPITPLSNFSRSETQNASDITRANLKVIAFSNPARNYFTLMTQSSSKELLQLRVLDLYGRSVEAKVGIIPNTTFQIGYKLKPGIYLAEVIQGNQKQVVKLIRQ